MFLRTIIGSFMWSFIIFLLINILLLFIYDSSILACYRFTCLSLLECFYEFLFLSFYLCKLIVNWLQNHPTVETNSSHFDYYDDVAFQIKDYTRLIELLVRSCTMKPRLRIRRVFGTISILFLHQKFILISSYKLDLV